MSNLAVITGASGMDSTYLAKYLIDQDYTVVGILRRNSTSNNERLRFIESDKFITTYGDITDAASIARIVQQYQPDEFYALAANSFVGCSWSSPNHVIETNTIGVINCLEAVRQYKKDCRFYFAGSSVIGDTPILVRKDNNVALIKIEDLFSGDKDNNILYEQHTLKDIEVLTIDNSNQVCFMPINGISKHPKNKIYQLKYKTGGELLITGDHSVIVFDDNGNLVPKRVDALTTNDYLISFNGSDIDYKPSVEIALNLEKRCKNKIKNYIRSVLVDKDIMRLLGYYVAEGHCDFNDANRSYRTSWTFHIDELEYDQDVKTIINSKFPELNHSTILRELSHSRVIRCNSIVLATLCSQFGHNAHEKHLPQWIWQLDTSCIYEFLKGYFGDARITRNEIRYTTVSKDLAFELVYLMKLHGLNARIIKRFNKAHLSPQKTTIKDSWCYDIMFSSSSIARLMKTEFSYETKLQPSLECLPSNIFYSHIKSSVKNIISKSRLKKLSTKNSWKLSVKERELITSHLGVLKVLSVNEISNTRPVYDISVPGVQRFIGGKVPVLLHNSEMYGDHVRRVGGNVLLNEDSPMIAASPYGVSKVAGYQMTRVYRESYDMFAACGILFNHSDLLRGTEFFTRKVTYQLARIKQGLQDTIMLGNLNAQRDEGASRDYVRAMHAMLQQDEPQDFVIATGETHSCMEWLDLSLENIGLASDVVRIDSGLYRPNEVNVLIGDASKAKALLQWSPRISFAELNWAMCQYDMGLIDNPLNNDMFGAYNRSW